MRKMMKGRLPLALLGNDRLVQGAWCVGFADIPRFRLAVPTPNLIESHRPLAGGVPSRTTADTVYQAKNMGCLSCANRTAV